MKKILIATLATAALFSSMNGMADSKKASTAMKVSSSGEAMHKKSPEKIVANRNLAKAKKSNARKVASK